MGGPGAWEKLAPDDDISSEAEIKQRQRGWRRAHPRTVAFWGAINRAAIQAVRKPNSVITCGRVAKSATTTVPIVFIASDPLGSGLVSSLARPAGNLTGFSLALGDEFSSKWLELLKEAVPSISRVAVLWNPVNPASSHYVTVLQDAAEKLGVRVQPQAVSDPDQFNGAFATIVAERAQALIVVVDAVTARYRERVVELAMKSRLPAMYGFREFVDAGGLIAYGVNVPYLCRRAAVYVDKIIKGAKPAELPVEQPTRFELVINVKTAKALGLTVPDNLLALADEVIE